MKISHQYKLLPNTEQKATMNRWLDMLRHQYNWLLADRFRWWKENRCDTNACPLICHGDSNGNRSGRPRFKGKNRYRSFTYTQIGNEDVQGNRINLSKIGWVKVILHRPLPDGFKTKTAVITLKPDGWYITFTLEDGAVPELVSNLEPTEENSIGIDLGLEKFLSDSEQGFEPIPQHFRRSEERLAKLQQKAFTRKKGSRARKLLNRKVAKLHQKVARQRRQFHFETAKKVLNKADVVFVEGLSVKNMSRRAKPKKDEAGSFLANGQSAKSGLNKSIESMLAGVSSLRYLLLRLKELGKKLSRLTPKELVSIAPSA